MSMKTSDAGIFALALHEGIVPAPYKDSAGVWTYGIGHTAAAGDPDPARMPRGMPTDLDAALRAVFAQFRADLPKYEAAVNRAVKVQITQAQFDALVSFHYNTGAIGRASFVRKLNASDVAGAASGFMAWSKPPEIINRRKAEQALFANGRYPDGKVTVWQVNGSGGVIWKPVRQMNRAQVLELVRGKQDVQIPVVASKTADPVIKPASPQPRDDNRAPAMPGKLIVALLAALAAIAAWGRDLLDRIGNLFN